MSTYAVTGATGHLGALAIDALLERGVAPADIVAIVRTPARADELARRGVTVRAGDYSRPDTLPAALAGVDVLLLVSGNELGQRVAQHGAVIEAAKGAGVARIAYTSVLRADTSPVVLAPEHRGTEQVLQASGVPFTILRNGWYTENYTGSVQGALTGGAFIGSAGEGRISSAARADYAEAAATVLTSAGHEGKTYELAGDEAYTLTDLATEMSRQSGKAIPYKNLSETDYAAVLAGFGLPVGLAQAIAGWDVGASKGALFDDGRQLARLIGRPSTPLSAMVAGALG
jgi:NAD(P)H dehydrogenase (quinone)